MLDNMHQTLLASRYNPPTITFNAVQRTALLKKIEDDSAHQVIVISAPAGSGKTTLLTQYANRHPETTCWYSIGPSASNPVRYWSYAIHALCRVFPAIPKAVLLQAFSNREFTQAAASLLNAIGAIDEKVTLILDSTQNIASQTIWDQIGYFCNNLPANARVVLSGRGLPRLPLSRMALEGRTTRIMLSQLAFDRGETTRLFELMGFIPTEAESLKIFDNAHGWPAITMAMIQLGKEARIRRDAVYSVADNPAIVDFLREEVFVGMNPNTFRFLELTSILPYFAESDCREFLRFVDEDLANSAETHIESLFRDHALLERAVGRGYRCNRVVAKYLKDNLAAHDQDAYRSICQSMAAMLENRNKMNEAIPLALEAEDWPRAIRLILASYSQLGMTAGFIDLCNWLDQIPDEYFGEYPELNIAKAMALIPTGNVEESERLLNRAESLLQGQEAIGARPANDFMVHCEIPIIRAYNNAFTVLKGDELLLYSAQAEHQLGSNRNEAIEGSVMLMDGIGSLLQGEYQQAEECLTSEMENMGNGVSLFTPLLATYYLAMLEYQRGNLERAADLLEMALDQISHDEGMKGFIGIFHVLYAWVLYDQNRLDECLEHAIAGMAESREWAAQTSLSDAYEVLSCVYAALGREADLQRLARQRRRNKQLKYPLFSHLSLNQDRTNAFIQPRGRSPKSAMGIQRIWFQRQAIHKQIVDKEWETLAEALQRLADEARQEGLLAYVLEAQALNGLVLHRLNRDDAAMDALREALEIAEAHGQSRVFLDEGEDMRVLLRSARKEGIAPSFITRLLRAFPEGEAVAEANLSKREIDVLSYLARGLTPKQIAEEMYVSVGTVRTHLHHIYGKLGVSGQTEAILEAQRQGLV